MKFPFIPIIVLFLGSNLFAQQDSTKKSIGIETSLIVGYTGFNQFFGPVLGIDNHQMYLGPKVNFNSFYLPGHSHLGLNAGYRYFYLKSSKIASFVCVDYQLSLFKLYDPYGHFDDSKRNHIQELVIGLGSQVKILPRLYTNLCFGFGAYREKFHTIEDNDATDDFYGLTINARVSVQYKLFNK